MYKKQHTVLTIAVVVVSLADAAVVTTVNWAGATMLTISFS